MSEISSEPEIEEVIDLNIK